MSCVILLWEAQRRADLLRQRSQYDRFMSRTNEQFQLESWIGWGWFLVLLRIRIASCQLFLPMLIRMPLSHQSTIKPLLRFYSMQRYKKLTMSYTQWQNCMSWSEKISCKSSLFFSLVCTIKPAWKGTVIWSEMNDNWRSSGRVGKLTWSDFSAVQDNYLFEFLRWWNGRDQRASSMRVT